jgi:hypothetical protein
MIKIWFGHEANPIFSFKIELWILFVVIVIFYCLYLLIKNPK